jgi:tetratricopeptide (TPR) repeat protein
MERFPVDCATAPLPVAVDSGNRQAEFNRWANAASVLLALHRNQEAVLASGRALSIFSDSAALWYIHAQSLLLTGQTHEAEQALLQSAALEVNVATWSQLADLYRRQRRFPAAIDALERLAVISPDPPDILLALGYTYLESGRPKDALQAFDRTEKALPAGTTNPALAETYNGRALAWNMAGDFGKATLFEEKAVRLAPETPSYWSRLAQFYDRQGRTIDAQKAREKAAGLTGGREP